MAEYLDDLLAFHHLFNISVYPSQVFLLTAEILAGTAAQPGGGKQHHTHHQHGKNRQRNIQHQHAHKRSHQRHHGIQRLRNTLADQLSQRIHIVGIDRHDIAMGMRIKVADRKSLHMCKQLHPQPSHGSLAHVYHDPVISIRAYNSYNKDRRQSYQRRGQAAEIRSIRRRHRQNIIVDQTLHEQSPLQRAQGRSQHAYDHSQAGAFVIFQHVS